MNEAVKTSLIENELEDRTFTADELKIEKVTNVINSADKK